MPSSRVATGGKGGTVCKRRGRVAVVDIVGVPVFLSARIRFFVALRCYHRVMEVKGTVRRSRGRWFVVLASVTLLALVVAGIKLLPRLAAAKAQPVAVAPPRVPVQTAEILLTGKIRAQTVINVAPPLEGTVGAFFVDVGQEVFEGQLLARLSNQALETGEETAQRTIDSAQARIDKLESQIVAARLEASRARADATRARSEYDRVDKIYRRQQMLFAEGATPRLTYEKSNSRLRYRASRA